MTKPFTSSASLSVAWKAFASHWKFIVPATFATAVTIILLQVISKSVERQPLLSLIIAIIVTIAGIAITLGWTNISMQLVRGHGANWRDFKTDKKSWVYYFLARLIYGFFTVAAMILIFIPFFLLFISAGSGVSLIIIGILAGIAGFALLVWLTIRYMFISFVAIDHPNMGAWDMLKESVKLGKGHMLDLFGFGLLLLLINIVGLLLFVVGLLVAVPVSKIAVAHVYEQLKKKHSA